jgi:cytochrome o ubiquinol oxidase subunit 2
MRRPEAGVKRRGGPLLALQLIIALLLLSGCSTAIVLHPRGYIGIAEKNIILTVAGLMLIVVVPIIVLTPLFVWKYRASRWKQEHAARPLYSKTLDAVLWLVPAAIVVVLGTINWHMSHRLDPFQPIASQAKPLDIQVISLDWKWLFIYPDEKIAVVNETAFPVNVPVTFHITSDTVMNSFFIPQLGSQIYAMAGMHTEVHLIADTVGEYLGISSNISGLGFSGMHFPARAMSPEDFTRWVSSAKASRKKLDMETYRQLGKPSYHNPVTYFTLAEPRLFQSVIGKYAYGHAGHGH